MSIVACPTATPKETPPCRCAALRTLPFPYNFDPRSRNFLVCLLDGSVARC